MNLTPSIRGLKRVPTEAINIPDVDCTVGIPQIIRPTLALQGQWPSAFVRTVQHMFLLQRDWLATTLIGHTMETQ